MVGWILPKGFSGYEEINSSDPGASKSDFPEFPLSGTVLENMWDLVAVNGDQIIGDLNVVKEAGGVRKGYVLEATSVGIGKEGNLRIDLGPKTGKTVLSGIKLRRADQ